MKSKIFVLFTFILILQPISIWADEPLPPPKDYFINSANGKYTAFFSVKDKKTIVYELVGKIKKEKQKIWEMDGWFRNTYLSNDGNNLIVAYEGANLLDNNYKTDQVMISFYDKGKLLKEIKLNQLIENPVPEKLEKTVSHYSWVETYGMNENQQFEVNTIKKKKFLFDIKTGNIIGGELYSSSNTFNDNQNTVSQNSANTKPTGTGKTNSCSAAVLGIAGIAVASSLLKSSR